MGKELIAAYGKGVKAGRSGLGRHYNPYDRPKTRMGGCSVYGEWDKGCQEGLRLRNERFMIKPTKE